MLLRLVAVAFFFLATSVVVSAQLSPGPLSRAHGSLEGATSCTSCHKPGGDKIFRCLECHGEIAARVNEGKGFHAKVVPKGTASQNCAECHSEHNGQEFPLIKWQPSQEKFDHSKTGWALDGKHLGLACNKCHTPERAQQAEKSGTKVKNPNRSFLGLSRECVSCHVDEHRGQLGKNCLQCHNTTDWKKVINFDHSKTRFALTGAHAKVNCEKCHTPGPDQKPRWKGIPFERCESCHKDPHGGSFTATCQTCHNTSAWKAVSETALNTRFNHDQTKYPLRGKHAEVGCTKCHSGGDFNKPIAFQQCANCHRPDPHSGQFAQRPDKGECAACHTVDGFKPAKFGVPEHKQTGYPLEGKHAEVKCEKCHIPAGKATIYKVKFARCTDCHRDQHAGQFQAAPHRNRCEDCHNVKNFSPSLFSLAQHNKTKFVLWGAHVAVACGDCHKKGRTPQFAEVAQYKFEDESCTACHLDPHRGQFRERMMKAGRDGKAQGCVVCHSMESWKDLTKFDHSTTKFELIGAHRAVGCADCHKPPNLETRMFNVDFEKVPSTCDGCHEDPHAKQFLTAGKPTQCSSCHNSTKWKPTIFDHNTRTTFKLEGVHANVKCALCHTLKKIVDEKEVVFYKPTPKECAACHGPAQL
jgi:hypothetical protein